MNEPLDATTDNARPEPLPTFQRRILGVLMEKARTTPDAYPLSLNGIVTAANQKSNRHPLMSLSHEQIEDVLNEMREKGIVSEVHGGGRVPKYRHFGSDYMSVKGPEVGVMIELLLRGEQTLGELRTRASRFEPIADQGKLSEILRSLIDRGLVVELTPPGRGQLVTHNLYQDYELEELKKEAASGRPAPAAPRARQSAANSQELADLKEEVATLRQLVEQLSDRVSRLES